MSSKCRFMSTGVKNVDTRWNCCSNPAVVQSRNVKNVAAPAWRSSFPLLEWEETARIPCPRLAAAAPVRQVHVRLRDAGLPAHASPARINDQGGGSQTAPLRD
jgi:hypothetical protein